MNKEYIGGKVPVGELIDTLWNVNTHRSPHKFLSASAN